MESHPFKQKNRIDMHTISLTCTPLFDGNVVSGFGVGLYIAGNPCSDEYRGPGPDSEPETRALQYGFNQYLSNITSALSLHRLVFGQPPQDNSNSSLISMRFHIIFLILAVQCM